MNTPERSNLQHRSDANDEWHTVHSDLARSSSPELELARWFEMPDAVDEPGEWRCVIRFSDGTEVIGEELIVEIGESK